MMMMRHQPNQVWIAKGSVVQDYIYIFSRQSLDTQTQ